jgi:subtilisin family serine protease
LNGSLVDWHVAPLGGHDGADDGADDGTHDSSGDGGLWLISGYVAERVGTPEYARHAHTLVQAILGTGTVRRAEADVPGTAFVGAGGDRRIGVGGGPPFPPGSERSRWAREAIRCDEAWAIEPGQGSGTLIGHPDTGYTLHPNLCTEALDLLIDWDFICNDDDARDPMVSPDDSPWPLPFPGHGTTTASVLVGRGSEASGIVGVAPQSRVVPLRAVESVIQLFDSDVARAVNYARLTGCHVLSISLGGKGFFGLQAAIARAVAAGMIVVAAAGNNVGIVVAPASYPNCLAVAATGPDDQPWPESSRGRAVDVCAPGWGVHVAGYLWEDNTPHPQVIQSSGTSYAATHVAGVAALWVAHHGADALRERYGARVQAAFLHLLRNGGSRTPAGWDAGHFGAGIVDAAAVLAAPLPTPEEVDDGIRGLVAERPLARLSALVDATEPDLERGLAEVLGRSGHELHEAVSRFEGELAFHLLEAPDFRAAVLGGGCAESEGLGVSETCSPEFAAMFVGRCQGT